MARKKANYPLVEGLEITTLAAEGKAMGRWNDVVVFVPLTVPGDVVDVQIRSKRRRFMEGFVVRYVKKSPLRAEAFCEHFGVCGGCKWQNLPYGEQLRFKTDQVRDQLTRIGKIELPEIAPCLGSAETQFYRNKLEFTFADRRWLTREEIESAGDIGDAPGRWDSTSRGCSTRCWTSANAGCSPTRRTASAWRPSASASRTATRSTTPASTQGLMRNMIVRTASTGEVMVIVVFGEDDRPRIAALMDHLAAEFPADHLAVLHRQHEVQRLGGRPRPGLLPAARTISSRRWRGCASRWDPSRSTRPIPRRPTSFTRWRASSPTSNRSDVLYDLYTGTGTIANFCAARCRPGGGRGVCARSDRRREGQFGNQRHRKYGLSMPGDMKAGARATDSSPPTAVPT